MTDVQLQSLLDQAAQLRAEIDALTDQAAAKIQQLDALKKEIAEAAVSTRTEMATPTSGGGRSWNFSASSGAAIRVTKPAPKLRSNFSGEIIAQLKGLCGRKFAKLFVVKYTCQKNFRVLAYHFLPDKETAQQVITLCEEPSVATVTIG